MTLHLRPQRCLPLTLAVVLASVPAHAQQRPPQGPPQGAPQGPEPDFGRFLFPPELIIQHQQDIGLRPEQRKAITDAIQQLQARVLELQWSMQDETRKLADLLQASTVREDDALAQVDRVLAVEREIKRAHLATLIRIKNTLTPEQRATLMTFR